MNIEFLQRHWALAAAAVLFSIVAVVVMLAILRRSAWGQLRHTLADLKSRSKERETALSAARRAEKTLSKLLPRADKIKPRLLQEARDLLDDTRALAKIADDQLMIAKNHVRRVIHEEYPPRAQERLRRKHLADDQTDGKPFSF